MPTNTEVKKAMLSMDKTLVDENNSTKFYNTLPRIIIPSYQCRIETCYRKEDRQ